MATSERSRELQHAFEHYWQMIGPAYAVSREHITQLIFALSADGDKEDADALALACVLEIMKDIEQREKQKPH